MKKLLSIILAAAMLLSLIPSVFALEGEGTVAEPIVYDLTTGSFDVENLHDFKENEIGITKEKADGKWGGLIYNPALFTYEKVVTTNASGETVEAFSPMKEDANKWRLEYEHETAYRIVHTNYFRADFDNKNFEEAKTSFSIRIKVPATGNYDITLSYPSGSSLGCRANVYFAKADENRTYSNTDLSDLTKNKLGIYISDTAVYGYGTMTVKGQTLEAGDYLFVFTPNAKCIKDSEETRIYLSSITLTPHDETAVETEVPFSLPQKILHKDETLTLEGVPYGAVLTSSNPAILTVNAKGQVTGKAMGKATVTADVNGEKQSIEIPVVGVNKISKADSYFENGVYYNSTNYTNVMGNASSQDDTLWKYYWINSNSDAIKASSVSDILLPGRTVSVNGINVDKGATRMYFTTKTQADAIKVEVDRIYELTGWVKIDKKGEQPLPNGINVRFAPFTHFTHKNGTTGWDSKGALVYPWGSESSPITTGETTGWTRVSSGSRLQQYTNIDVSKAIYIEPRFVFVAQTGTAASVNFTEFSLHEVVFDRIDLLNNEFNIETGNEENRTATISVSGYYSNTGEKILNVDAKSITPTKREYESADASVAMVDENGTITAVGRGETTVTIKVTIGGVTKTAEVKVIVDGGDYKLPETVTAGVLTNYKDAASGVTAAGYTVNNTKDVVTGTKITAEAKDTTDYKFICWKVGGAFLQTDAKVENYVVNTNTSLTAVYEPINTELKIVEFWNANKQFLSMDDNRDNEITIPTAPAVTGFTLTGEWLVDEGKYLDVNNLPVGTTRAVAEVEDTKNVIIGSVKYADAEVSEEHIYGTEVTRTVDDATYWTRDGEPVFFGKTYTYFMWDGTEIKAHADEITPEPVIILDDPANGAYMIEYCVPEGFTKVEAGILFGMAGSEPKVSEFSSKAAAQSADAHGQFTAQADADEEVVRGYLIYQVDGEKKIIYTDVYTATAE